MTGRKGLALAGTDAEWRGQQINVVPTMSRSHPLSQNYSHGGLTKDKEQSKADPNSLISLPNGIRSDDKNDCHRGKVNINSIDSFAHHTYFPNQPTPQKRALESARDKSRAIRQRGRKQELRQQIPTREGTGDSRA